VLSTQFKICHVRSFTVPRSDISFFLICTSVSRATGIHCQEGLDDVYLPMATCKPGAQGSCVPVPWYVLSVHHLRCCILVASEPHFLAVMILIEQFLLAESSKPNHIEADSRARILPWMWLLFIPGYAVETSIFMKGKLSADPISHVCLLCSFRFLGTQ
jgi:hypothetical protein